MRRAGERSGCRNTPLGRKRAGAEQPRVLRSLSLKKGVKEANHFCPQLAQIVCSQGIGQFLKLLRMTAFEECIGTLLKIDAFGTHELVVRHASVSRGFSIVFQYALRAEV